MPIPPTIRTPRESLKTTRFWIRVGTWIIGLVVVLRAISYLQSGGLVADLTGAAPAPPVDTAGAYQLSNPARSAHVLTNGNGATSLKKDH